LASETLVYINKSKIGYKSRKRGFGVLGAICNWSKVKHLTYCCTRFFEASTDRKEDTETVELVEIKEEDCLMNKSSKVVLKS
jgi:hypothetical protein